MRTKKHEPFPLEKEFQTYLGLKGRSPKTISMYCRTLANLPIRRLSKLPQGAGRDTAFKRAKEPLDKILARPSFPNRNNIIPAVRSFCSFLAAEKYLTLDELNYFREVYKRNKKGQNKQKEKWAVPRTEWLKVIRLGIHKSAKMALWLGFNFGFRRDEICHLRVKDINFTDQEIQIRVQYLDKKGQKEWGPKSATASREVPFSDDQAQVLQEWIENRPEECPHPYLLYLSNLAHFHDNAIYSWCINAGKRYGFEKNLTVHTLRYSFACYYYYETPMKLKTLSELLGHADISQTSDYLELGKKESKEEARRYIT